MCSHLYLYACAEFHAFALIRAFTLVFASVLMLIVFSHIFIVYTSYLLSCLGAFALRCYCS